MTGGMTLSAQSAKNTIPNYNINAMDNLNVNNMYMQNIPSKFNSQGIPILVNNMTDRSNHPNIPNNLINNAHNNFMMKNNQINCQHNNGWVDGYKVFYFNETDDFMLISRKDLTATILDNYQSKVTICLKVNYG